MVALISQTISQLPKGLRTRFAPSPTGYLHLGHVASAIYVWGIAERAEAKVVLRIEDHDQSRCRPHYETSIRETLDWLGFHPDFGGEKDGLSPYRQSQHPERYEAALGKLSTQIYRCQCSRKEIIARNSQATSLPELLYDGHCRESNQGPNIRLKIPEREISFSDGIVGSVSQNPAKQCGDLLLKDRDSQWTYNFAVAVDDFEEGIDLIIRGQDILPSTARQLYLRELFGGTPFYSFHHPLIWADAEKKLSKRDHATSIDQWREQGYSAEDILGKAAQLVGLIAEERKLSRAQVGELFS